jgi:hypothetical protein
VIAGVKAVILFIGCLACTNDALLKKSASMKNKKGPKKLPIEEVGITYSNAPKTHIFYEYQGERAIDPTLLVENGISLWHEQMLNIPEHDISHLWDYAKSLLASRQDTLVYSYIEWLRYEITMGTIIPEKWDRRRPYPYKWMLISAIYFQEARKLCEEGNTDRVWHVVTMAYYQLGMNTNPSLTQAMSKTAAIRHANDSEFKRAIVLAALDKIKEQNTAKSINEAKDKVLELIAGSKKVMEKLEELDASTSENTKHNKTNDALDRLRNTLDSWASPKGPYPELASAFSRFSKRKTKTQSGAIRATSEELPRDELPAEYAHYMRIVSYLEEGYVLTAEISRQAEEEVGAEPAE